MLTHPVQDVREVNNVVGSAYYQGRWYPTPPYPPHPKMLDNQNSDSYTFGCPPGGKIMQGPLRGFHQDLHSTFSYGPLQHLGQDRHILGTAPSNSCKIVIEGPDQISLPGSHRINISTAPQREWSATPSRHFVRGRPLSLWRGANLDLARTTVSALCTWQIALLVARCQFWYRSHNPLGTLCVADHSRCGAVRIWISALCTWQIALLVARCQFWYRSHNPLGTLCVADHSRCGAVRIWISLAQPFRHFARGRSLSLWHGANFDIARTTLSALCAWQTTLAVARCEFGSRSRNRFGTLHVADRSPCGTVPFDIARTTFSALCACQVALVVARCEFGSRSRNRFGTLHVADRSPCGTVPILISLAQHKVPRGLCERYQMAPCHKESDLPRAKCQNGCASEIQIRTAPQREWSATHKVPRGLCERYQNWHRATRRAICHVQSAETVARARSKFAPRHNESNLTGTKCREGCASDIKIGTVPQGERSATRKVPKRLRERDPNSHRATTRVIRHAQSHESLARAQNIFLQNIARTTKNEHWKCQSRCFTEVPFFFTKMSRRNLKCCTCHAESSSCPKSKMTVSQNEAF